MKKNIFNYLFFVFLATVPFIACKKKDAVDIVSPGCAQAISPANGAGVQTTSVTLSWSLVPGATTYDLYVGTNPNPSTLIATGISGNSFNYVLPNSNNLTYYWYVVPKNGNKKSSNCNNTISSFSFFTPPPPLGFIVVGYFPGYRYVAEYPDNMFKRFNIINYAFAAFNASSTISISAPATFDSVYNKAKANGAKVFLSINGSQADFLLLADASRRKIFLTSVMSFARSKNIDGIDMDYEYPRTSDGTDAIFNLLMKELSDSLHKTGKYLSAAITPGKYAGSVRDGIKDEVFGYTDFFNVMVYDDFSTTTPYKHHSDMSLVNTSMNYWLVTRKMPKEKFVLGIPVYGRNSGAIQVSSSFKSILEKGVQLGPSPIAQSDSATLFKADGSSYTIYYTGQASAILKAQKANSEAGGFMFWEIGQDVSTNNSIIKSACDAIGRVY